jgi:hypothetical protein
MKNGKIAKIKELLNKGFYSVEEIVNLSGANQKTVILQIRYVLNKERKIYAVTEANVIKYSYKETK